MLAHEEHEELLRRYLDGAQVSRPHDWPLFLQPMKLLAKPGDKGLGDIIDRTIGPVGGEAFKKWYKVVFGKDCGCNVRQIDWNRRYPLNEIT